MSKQVQEAYIVAAPVHRSARRRAACYLFQNETQNETYGVELILNYEI